MLLTTIGAVALDGVAVALFAWTTWTVFQSREKPSAPAFLAVLVTLASWSVFMLVPELPVATPWDGLEFLWELGQVAPAVALPGIWTVYTLGYTGRGTGLTRGRVIMLSGIVLPIALGALVLAVGPSESIVEGLIASLIGTELLYLFVLFLYGTYLLYGLSGKHARVSKRQFAVITLGISAPYLLASVGSGSSPANGVTLGLIVSGGLLAFAVRTYPVLTGFPKANHIARNRVVEGLQEAVVVLDWDNHVLDANTATAAFFDVSTPEIVGEPLSAVVDGLANRDLSAGATGTVGLQTTKGRRRFQFSVSAVDDIAAAGESGTDPVARTLLLRDVTDRETREERLTVLNRVLRHNVRNKLDVVLAHADLVADDELRTGIRDSATDLLSLSNKARDAEAMMSESLASPERVDVSAVARNVVESFRADTADADISLTCPDELTISSHRSVLEEILNELVENALTHTERDAPSVDVTVRSEANGAVEVSVADDGPGIPDRERQILSDGTETQLEHGQGLGLWFVNWAVTQLGGDLSFAENDPQGSVVTVRLYETTYSS